MTLEENANIYSSLRELYTYIKKKADDLSDTLASYTLTSGFRFSHHVVLKARLVQQLNKSTLKPMPPFSTFVKVMSEMSSFAVNLESPVDLLYEDKSKLGISNYVEALREAETKYIKTSNIRDNVFMIISDYFSTEKKTFMLRNEDALESGLFSCISNVSADVSVLGKTNLKSPLAYKNDLEATLKEACEKYNSITEEEYNTIMYKYIPELVGIYTKTLDLVTSLPYNRLYTFVDDIYDCL